MKVDCQKMQQRMQNFEAVCRGAGLKLTHQRREIFREVAQSERHPSAEHVYQAVRQRMPSVSLDTIYRTLWLLNKLGLIATVGFGREKTRFDANLDHHHHVVCVKCGLTQDFYSDEFDQLRLPESVKEFQAVEMAKLTVQGLCKNCVRKGFPPREAPPRLSAEEF